MALDRLGLFRLADHLEHHTAYTITAVASFAASLALQQAGAAGLLAASVAAPLSTAALVVPFLLLGAPQLAETLVAFAARQVDTHVLMSLSIVGTLYMGMAQEVRSYVTIMVLQPVHQWFRSHLSGRCSCLGDLTHTLCCCCWVLGPPATSPPAAVLHAPRQGQSHRCS